MMKIKDLFEKINYIDRIKDTKVMKTLSWFFLSPLYSFLTMVLLLLSHHYGLDIWMIGYIVVSGLIVAILMEDLTPVFVEMLFMGAIVSKVNAPLDYATNPNYYPEHLTSIIVWIAIYVGTLVLRLIFQYLTGKAKFNVLSISMIVFSLALLWNGFGTESYEQKNLMYAGFLAIIFAGCTMLFSGVKGDRKSFLCVGYAFAWFGLFLLVELIQEYLSLEDLKFEEMYLRAHIGHFGWGNRNTMGMFFCLCIPAVAYLSARFKYGWTIYPYCFILYGGAVMTMSRQAMLFGLVILLLSSIVLFIVSKDRFVEIGIFIVVAGLVFFAFANNSEEVKDFFYKLFKTILIDDESFDGGSRLPLFQKGWENFLSHKIFGIGFFIDELTHSSIESILPQLYHNTIIQILASCGLVGFIPYLFHRVSFFVSYFRHVTIERTFTLLIVLALLFVSLVDTHIFNYFPTLVYACLIGMMVKSERKA